MVEKNAPKDAPTGEDVGQAEVQEKVDEESEKGYRGATPDPLDDAAYTVEGVTTSDRAAKQDRGRGQSLVSTTDESYAGTPRPAGGN